MKLRLFFAVLAIAANALFGADQELLKLIPADAEFVAGIHAGQIRNSRFGQFLLDQIKSDDKNMEQFISMSGFDPRRDLDEMIVVAPGTLGAKRTLVAARGRFDQQKIQSFARTAANQTLTHNGVSLFAGDKANQGALAVLDGRTAVAGDMETVKAAIDRFKAGGVTSAEPKLLNRIAELSNRYDAWMISGSLARLAGDFRSPQVGGAMNNFTQAMDSVFGGVRFGPNVEVAAEATMRSDKDATAMVDVMKFIAGMIQLGSKDDKRAAEFSGLLDKMEVKASGTQFRMTLQIPEEMLEGMLKPVAVRKKPAI
ncbi:MAG: hypothetical protein HYZ37_07720 [Candidatus Solibacter usitatus]|nr:hypothetical protein [Candidatus Solibacter usitatus]